jgi:hypothetical protein
VSDPNDPLLGFSPDEIVVGAGGQTLAQAADDGAVRCVAASLIERALIGGDRVHAGDYPPGFALRLVAGDPRIGTEVEKAVIEALVTLVASAREYLFAVDEPGSDGFDRMDAASAALRKLVMP